MRNVTSALSVNTYGVATFSPAGSVGTFAIASQRESQGATPSVIAKGDATFLKEEGL